MIGVQILGLTKTGDKLLGQLVWDGKAIKAQPADSRLLQSILEDRIIAPGGKARLTAADGMTFLEALRFNYHSAYLRATEVMELKDTAAANDGIAAAAAKLRKPA